MKSNGTQLFEITTYDGKQIRTRKGSLTEATRAAAKRWHVVYAPCLGIMRCNRPGPKKPIGRSGRLGPDRWETLRFLQFNPGVFVRGTTMAELTRNPGLATSKFALPGQMTTIRAFLCDDPDDPDYIETRTVPSLSYRWKKSATWIWVEPIELGKFGRSAQNTQDDSGSGGSLAKAG